MKLPSLLLLVLTVVTSQDICGEDCQEDAPRRPCTRAEKKQFNANLLTLFRAEYGKEDAGFTNTNRILRWKFESLDRDDDGLLTRQEYKPLKRLKKLVKPKKCAKVFAKTCDKNRDMLISNDEWSHCLGVSLIGLKTSVSSVIGLSEYKKKKDEPEANDCTSDRQTVLAEQRAHELYVPECAPDGRYRQIQCYKSTGYCWCVNEDDGKPIPGTSVKDKAPDCNSVPAPQRPMKGCPPEVKDQFVDDLLEFLSKNVSNKEETVASAFDRFDRNSSKFLERREWKTFRTLVAAEKNLRRCGKRLPKFCDVNGDYRISLTEWSNCLNYHQGSRRRGLNPLKKILKDD